jgi:hypothetical protein
VSSGGRAVSRGRADITKLIVTFRNFAKAPKNATKWYVCLYLPVYQIAHWPIMSTEWWECLSLCGRLLTRWGTGGLLLAGAAVCYCYTQPENIKHIAQCVMNACTVRMISSWVVATCHSQQDLAHAYLSHSKQRSSHCLWTIGWNVPLSVPVSVTVSVHAIGCV